MLPLADAAHAGVAEAPEGAEHRLPLGIGDLWLQDDVDDHLGHAAEGTGWAIGADTTPVEGPVVHNRFPLTRVHRPALIPTGHRPAPLRWTTRPVRR
ncbi:hypothetical protein GCM10023328_02630 [Modestobacter marinus]|uniref:Uncharacterized protein n=1 Tax=Modestobacter marinus TaxID=477641 RepID=A0ABQ2FTZ6_9ACTN|nr:hypothetical protein GCM10011589_07330 [Modestobacter marinus]